MADVTFFFAAACPWTWRASRWLVGVAEARGLDIEWRACSLAMLNEGSDTEDEHAAAFGASTRALRLVEALRADGRQDDIGRFYTALGDLAHEGGAHLDDEVVAHAVRSAGLADYAVALDDASLDSAVRASTDTAMAAAGPGVGSPVLTLPGAERGVHGPVL